MLAAADSTGATDIEVLARGYLRDLAAHDEVEAQDTLALEDPPLVVELPEKPRRGPKRRPPPCPEALRASLFGRPTSRWGPRNSVSHLDDDALIFRLSTVTLHKGRGVSARDLDLQEEYFDRRGLNYPALTSARSSFQGRGLPDALRPLLGANRSRIRREIVAVLLHCASRKKTGASLSVLEWAMLLFVSKSAVAEHLAWLENHGFIITVSRYVPATHAQTPVEHRANFYTLGPRLVELRELWDHPHHVGAAKAAAAESLNTARRRHKFRILRGRHVPRSFQPPEEWIAAKADADVTALVDEDLERRRAAELVAQRAAAEREAAAQLAAGMAGGNVLRAMLAVNDGVRVELDKIRPILPRELLAEHDAARRVLDAGEVAAVAAEIARRADAESDDMEIDVEDLDDHDDAEVDLGELGPEVNLGELVDDVAAPEVDLGELGPEVHLGSADDLAADHDVAELAPADRDLGADVDPSNYEIAKPFRPLTGARDLTMNAAAATARATPPENERPSSPASRVAAVAPDPSDVGSVAPPKDHARPKLIGDAPCAHGRARAESQPPSDRSKQTGRMQPVSKDRSHPSQNKEHVPVDLRDLAERLDRGERPPPRPSSTRQAARTAGSAREAAASELMRAIARASERVQAHLRRDGPDEDTGPPGEVD